MNPFCKCGCGERVSKPTNIYLNGHYSKNKPSWNKGKKWDEKIKQKFSDSAKRKFENNPELRKKCGHNKLTIMKLKDKYPFIFNHEEIKEVSDKLYVKCKKCNTWFSPTYTQLAERIRALKEPKGFINNFLYCNEICKVECKYYNRHSDPDQFDKLTEYRLIVHRETSISIKEHKIKNIELRGEKYGYDLDHMYSVHRGFIDDIDPKIIGNHNNLQIITKEDNIKKREKCSITIEELKRKISNELG